MPDPLGNINFIWQYYLIFAAGYFLGSIPFGFLLTKLYGLGDIRNIGSGNIGATNVLRTGSKKLALFTLILDVSKGFIPALVVNQILFIDYTLVVCTGAIIGHIMPIWLIYSKKEKYFSILRDIVFMILGLILLLNGKDYISILGLIILLLSTTNAWGGKGVATSFGALLAINPLLGFLSIIVWLIIAKLTKISSISALTAFMAIPIFALLLHPFDLKEYSVDTQILEFSIFLSIIVIIRHLDNIKRIISGTEAKIGKNE